FLLGPVLLLLLLSPSLPFLFFSSYPPTTSATYPLSLHDALPISAPAAPRHQGCGSAPSTAPPPDCCRNCCMISARPIRTSRCSRSEEHTSELQSRFELVCRLLLEKKKAQTVATGQRNRRVGDEPR